MQPFPLSQVGGAGRGILNRFGRFARRQEDKFAASWRSGKGV